MSLIGRVAQDQQTQSYVNTYVNTSVNTCDNTSVNTYGSLLDYQQTEQEAQHDTELLNKLNQEFFMDFDNYKDDNPNDWIHPNQELNTNRVRHN